jgi:hypothetical protein
VRQLRDVRARQKRLENLLVTAYQALPTANYLDTIPGIGAVTAAILTAFIVAIDRFDAPGHLVAYFGTLPIEVDRDGQPRGPKRYVMSRRGNDLVRRYLWMAALSAVRCNPAVRALYARVVHKHPNHKAIAIGHAMRKLLHLVFAVWKTGKSFDPEHYPWATPAHREASAAPAGNPPETAGPPSSQPSDTPMSPEQQAAGHRNPDQPERKVVATACALPSLPKNETASDNAFVDFAHFQRQLPMTRVLDQLGLSTRLRAAEALPLPDPPRRRPRADFQRQPRRGRLLLPRSQLRQEGRCHRPMCPGAAPTPWQSGGWTSYADAA